MRSFLYLAKEFRGGCLIKAGLLLEAQDADRFQHAQRSQGIGVGGVFRLFEGYRDMALRRQVVDFTRLYLLDDADQTAGVGHIAVVEKEAAVFLVRVLIEVVDAIRIKK